MKVTVNICTWNRCTMLRQVLESMCRLSIPEGVDWELQVVNNACTDATDQVLAEFQGRLPLQILHESIPGKSRALNCGLEAARGDLILFTDDDAIVSPNWLAEYVQASTSWKEAAFFGGPVEPWFAVPPPKWVVRHLDSLQGPFAIRRSTAATRKISGTDESPFGVNMAVRRQVLRQDAFDVTLGPMQRSEIRGEETALLADLSRAGLYGVWVGTASVAHYIPAQRLMVRYLWAYYGGRGATYRRGSNDAVATLFGYPRYAIRQCAVSFIVMAALWPLKNASWLSAVKAFAQSYGVLRESSARGRVVEAVNLSMKELRGGDTPAVPSDGPASAEHSSSRRDGTPESAGAAVNA